MIETCAVQAELSLSVCEEGQGKLREASKSLLLNDLCVSVQSTYRFPASNGLKAVRKVSLLLGPCVDIKIRPSSLRLLASVWDGVRAQVRFLEQLASVR
jgi:hypothetical protein